MFAVYAEQVSSGHNHMQITPPSRREEYRNLGAYYESEIAPYLRAEEQRRRSAVQQSAGVSVITFFVAVSAYWLAPFGEANFQVAFVAAVLGLSLAGALLSKARSAITAGLLERISSFFNFSYQRELARPPFVSAFDRLQLLPFYNRQAWEDQVTGVRQAADFVLCEAHLRKVTRGKKRRVKTVFHGQLLVIDYHKKFLGETVIKRDAGVFNRFMKPGAEFQRIGIVSSRFEKAFEAWSTDQVEARELLDPIVLERFEALDSLFNGAKFRAAFSDGKLYIALETGDKLNMGTMFKSLEDPARFEKILKEFDLIFDLIDLAVKRLEGPLDSAVSAAVLR